MSSLPTHDNPYAPPQVGRRAHPSAQAGELYRTYRFRARVLRVFATLHLLFSLYLMIIGIIGLIGGIESWRSSIGDLSAYAHPDLVAAGHRKHAYEGFAMSFGGMAFSALNVAIAIGLWRFRPWAARVTAIHSCALVAFALIFGACTLYWWGEYSYLGGLLLFALPFVLVSIFVRSRKSSMVCSRAFHDALAEVRGARG